MLTCGKIRTRSEGQSARAVDFTTQLDRAPMGTVLVYLLARTTQLTQTCLQDLVLPEVCLRERENARKPSASSTGPANPALEQEEAQHANHTGSRKQVPHDAFLSGRMC